MAPATKRGRASSPQKAMKKAKPVDPIAEKISTIQAAFKDSELPASDMSMLTAVAPNCLSTTKPERHKFQDEVCQMIAQALQGIEAKIQAELSEAKDIVGKSEDEKLKREAAVTAAETDLGEKTSVMSARKSDLAADALVFKEKKKLLAEAKDEQQSGDDELEATASDKEKCDTVVKDLLEPVKEVAATKSQAKQIQDAASEFGFDASLILALPSALSAAAPRNSFQSLVLQQLYDAFASHQASLQAKLDAGAPAKAARAQAVNTTQAAFDGAKNKQIESAGVLKSAQEAERACESELKVARTALNKFGPEIKRAVSKCEKDEKRLSEFQAGALAAFKELLDRLPEPDSDEKDEEVPVEQEEAVTNEL